MGPLHLQRCSAAIGLKKDYPAFLEPAGDIYRDVIKELDPTVERTLAFQPHQYFTHRYSKWGK